MQLLLRRREGRGRGIGSRVCGGGFCGLHASELAVSKKVKVKVDVES